MLGPMNMARVSVSDWVGAGRKGVLLGVILLCAVSAFAQLARKRAAGPAIGDHTHSLEATEEGVRWETFLVKDAAEPTFRFVVAHQHGKSACYGELFITRGTMRYVVKAPAENRDHGFSYPRSSLTEARQWRFLRSAMPEVEYKFSGGGTYHFFRIRESMYENPSQKFAWDDVLTWQPLMTAALEFDQILAMAQQRLAAEKPKEVPTPSAPPKMRIMEPAISDPSQPVEVTQSTLTLRGAALDSRGVLSVMVGDRQAEIRSTGDIRAVEFSVKDIPLHEGLNRVNVVATNVDRQSAQMEILFWYRPPSAPPPTVTPTPAPPPPAPAPIETETTTPAAPAGGPLDTVPLHKDEILQMVKNAFPSEQIADLVKDSGIDFEPTDDYLESLRQAGAKDILIDALRKAKRAKQ